MSVSFTKYIAIRMAYLCDDGEVRNSIIFVIMLIVNYLLLVFWSPITSLSREMIIFLRNILVDIPSQMPSNVLLPIILTPIVYGLLFGINFGLNSILLFKQSHEIDAFEFHLLALFPSLFRLTLSIVFVGSFLARPLVMRPVNLVWRRIVESDKPVFTLIFGGVAAFATALSEAAKYL